MSRRAIVAVALGGVCGAALRWAAVETIPAGNWHWGLILVNTVGSALLGFLLARPSRLAGLRTDIHLGATTGLCGSLTTLSGFSVAAAVLLRDGAYLDTVAFVVISLAAGLAAVWATRTVTRAVLA